MEKYSKPHILVGKIMRAMDSRGMFTSDDDRIRKLDALADSSMVKLRSI